MPAKKTKTFREARERLDEILDELEQDGGDVDQLASRVKEASELVRFCRDRLSAAKVEVQQVVADLVVEDGGETAVEEGEAEEEADPDEGGSLSF
ncbi:MAG: exodeoxyribonuclease VII small subunit [Planctomycetota bacterium]|nr:exodeoxyribonuclease VII small subunit [Planctomycetota bacterium]